MKKKKKRDSLKTVTAVSASILVFLSACSNAAPETNEPPKPANTDETRTNVEPLGKYDPPIEVKIGRTADNYKFEEGKSIDNNHVYDFYEKELGVKLKNEWVVPSEQYAAKSNVSISSGNIPDMFWVDGVQLRNLVEADMIEDLSDVYEQYVSEDTKRTLEEDGGYALNAATIDGKLYAFPSTTQGFWTANVLWVRQDWLDKLGLQPPKTIDELIHVASEFVKKNPGGKGTYGLGVTKDLDELNGFFNSFHAYPFQWIKDSEGKIAYGGIQPETKAALLKLQDMYRSGLLDMEFGVKDASKLMEAVVAEKLGLFYSSFGFPFAGARDLFVNNPDADLRAYPMPSIDDKPAKAYIGPTVREFWVVKKGFKHPEAIIKLANFYMENWNKNLKEENNMSPDKSIMYWQYALMPFNSPMMQINEHRTVKAAILAKEQPDRSKHTANEYQYIEGIYNYMADPRNTSDPAIQTGWMYQKTFGTPNSGAEALDHYYTNDQIIMTPLKAASTPTMSQKMPTLTKLEKVLYTKIILGEADGADFDKFVEDWKKQGGQDILKELNAQQ